MPSCRAIVVSVRKMKQRLDVGRATRQAAGTTEHEQLEAGAQALLNLQRLFCPFGVFFIVSGGAPAPHVCWRGCVCNSRQPQHDHAPAAKTIFAKYSTHPHRMISCHPNSPVETLAAEQLQGSVSTAAVCAPLNPDHGSGK